MAKKTTASQPSTVDSPEPTPMPTVSLSTQDWQSVCALIEVGAKALGCQMQEDGSTTFETAGRLIREISTQSQWSK